MGEIRPKKCEPRELTKDQLGSAGVVLWELITRKEPYKGMAPLQVIAAVVFQVIPTPLHVLDRISPIFPPFFPVFCAFSPSRRGSSNAASRNPGPRNIGKGVRTLSLRSG